MINVSHNVARSQELAAQISAFLAAGNSIKELAPGETGLIENKPIQRPSTYKKASKNLNKPEVKEIPEPSEYLQRINFNRAERHKAELAGSSFFNGKCANHGFSQFQIIADRHYCTECRKESARKTDIKRKQRYAMFRSQHAHNAQINAHK
ncbi:hypothetical protein [uncultured Acinetobacter sp.]|uniref:hypothetical protein n=1 Tax=uncultured Acinetobacter sp. TaxID=165433 RepID=UPI003749E733